MDQYDVVIVGAGPAGLNCARALGNSKLNVLVIEKNNIIGDKVCAGGLTSKSVSYLKLPRDLIDFCYKEIVVNINNLKSHMKNEAEFICTIDRKRLGGWQASELSKFKKIKIIKGTLVSEIGKNFIIADNKKINFRYLVGADSSFSVVRKFLGLKSEKMGFGMQYIIKDKKFKDLEVILDSRLFMGWYAWIFPHKSYVSIGCGCDPKILNPKKLKKNFDLWLEKNKIDVSKAKLEASLINCDYKGFRFGNIFLVGDAAGLSSGFSGEGIYQALISGEEAARCILDNNYHPRMIDSLLKYKRRHEFLSKLLINSGIFRQFLFYLGAFLIKFRFIRKKVIKVVF